MTFRERPALLKGAFTSKTEWEDGPGLTREKPQGSRGGGGKELGGGDHRGSHPLELENCTVCVSQRDDLSLSFVMLCTVHGQDTECSTSG